MTIRKDVTEQTNRARRPDGTAAERNGLHLVEHGSRTASTAAPETREVTEQRGRSAGLLTLGVTALAAPAVWLLHAILHHFHVL